jgi:hypothetical protein
MISLIQRDVSVAAVAKVGRQTRKESQVFFILLIVFVFNYWFLVLAHLKPLQVKQGDG